MNGDIPQHKRLAMGQAAGFARGGLVDKGRQLKSGFPDGPVEKAKRANGVPGYAGGGKASRKGGARGC